MSSTEHNFESVRSEIQERYQSGDYAGALDLAERYKTRFQDQAAIFTYWQVCFNVRIGNVERSIQHLRSALRNGLWYGDVLLRKSPSLLPLQGLPEYESLVYLNRELQDRDETRQYPMIILRSEGRCSLGSSPCPLLLGLHANAGTVQSSLSFWRQAANAGWLVAAPQSTQAMWKGSFIWDDRESSREEVLHHFQTVINSYSVDPDKIVLGGHSMGGEVAIWMALSSAIPAAGFLAFGPGGPMMDNPDLWLPYIEAASSRIDAGLDEMDSNVSRDISLRGYLVYGMEDRTVQHQNIRTLAEMLEAAGIPCRVEAITGVGHDFDPQFEAALLRGLEFISPR